MKLIVAILFCASFILIFGEHGVIGIGPEPDKPTTIPPRTTVGPNITTSAPTTTTKAPPITTTPTTTTTTMSTTVAPSTTTPKPTPPPIPQPGEWIVNGTNNTCIIVRMSAQFNVTYVNSNNKSESKNIVLPSNNSSTIVTGVCGDTEQVINITWGSSITYNDSLKLHFVKNGTKDYSLHHIELYLGPGELPNVTSNNTIILIHNTSEYKTGLDNSYRCVKLQRISLTSNINNLTGVIEVKDLQFQAFRTDKTKIFGLAEDCAVETQDLVPIAVGCALIILVVIVLVAYLIGRRRRQAGGYLSM